MGATGGEQDWLTAVGDVQTWLDWLKTRPGVRADELAIVGARIVAHLAINGCSNDSACFAVVALSPGCVRSEAANCLDGYTSIPKLKEVSEMTADAVSSTPVPPIFIAVSQGNAGFADSAKTLVALSEGEFSLWFYTGKLFKRQPVAPGRAAHKAHSGVDRGTYAASLDSTKKTSQGCF